MVTTITPIQHHCGTKACHLSLLMAPLSTKKSLTMILNVGKIEITIYVPIMPTVLTVSLSANAHNLAIP